MAAIALRRGGSFSSASGSSDYGTGSHDDDHSNFVYGGGGGIPTASQLYGGGGGGIPSASQLYGGGGGIPTASQLYGGGGGGGIPSANQLYGGGGGIPSANQLYGGSQSFGPTLSSLQFDPDVKRRHSLMENQNLSQASGLGDDLSLVGECDNNSIRSNRSDRRPGRRASLSAAIELTRTPPKRTASSTQKRGRRNSLFGNNNGTKEKDKEKADKESSEAMIAKLSQKKGSRRASMAGYPAASATSVTEPEPTPSFFQPRSKKDKRPGVPDRRKTRSFEKSDRKYTSQSRPGEKIKRPAKGGSRRASLAALPRRMSLSRSSGGGSKSSKKGSNRSLLSHSNSSDSYADVSDDDSYYGTSGRDNSSGGESGPTFGRTNTAPAAGYRPKKKDPSKVDLGYGDDPKCDPDLPPPPPPVKRTGSKESVKRAFRRRGSKKASAIKAEDLGYGHGQSAEEYDPQLPPPPPPPPPKKSGSSATVKNAFRNRRGSTGMAASFTSTTAAQRSLKESLQWKASQHGNNSPRRTSAASSIANSVATDVASNVRGQQQQQQQQRRRGPSDVPPGGRRAPMDVPPPRKGPADVPPPRRGPADVPPGGRRVPQDVAPGPARRGPADVPPSQERRYSSVAPSDMDSSASSFSMDSDFNPTPILSNRKTREPPSLMQGGSQHSHGGLSTMGHVSGNTSTALGAMMMDDVSDGSQSSAGGALSLGGASLSQERRGSSRGTATVQNRNAAARYTHGSSQAQLHGSTASGFNPYSSVIASSGASDDDDDEEEVDEEEEAKMKQKDEEEKPVEAETATSTTTTSKTVSDDGDGPTNGSTTDTDPTFLTTTNTDVGGAVADFKIPEDSKKQHDGGSDGSMTSEVPNETDNMRDVDNQLEEIGATGDWSEIGATGTATGDWSGLVTDEMVNRSKARVAENKSLLDRYPGSEVDFDGGLGYGYSHMDKVGVMNAYDDESERKSELDNGYGLSDLYDEDYSSFGWRDNRPRAAESMEFINMEQLMSKAKSTKGLHLPTFTPAHGCTNASDFIVRCFVARLRAGMTVTKHSRSRFCKSHDRILHILPTGYHITWIPETEEEVLAKSTKKPPTKLDLTKCLEVRHAWSRDPKSSRYTGTSTLRSKCKEGAANRSFALIYAHRTVDFTAATVDQCKILMEGFSALCFRLQMARLEQQENDDDTTQHTAASGVGHDDDSTTASLTGTNMSAPWGL
ncbi:expressed unknown protein [Seminavis robusta]|uniref:Uncharacterized protein n=1 Tax=Seminavis robusta TaxID=568900 RepID=A0A9N8EPV6_9STRA|nr:expressed unknown protein [Seminavis robusta]|eukprot:Sro1728_g293990.1 n/a (1207) ;mRNA; f:19232-22852